MINYISCMANRIKNFQTRRQLKEENEKLKEQIERLKFQPPTIQYERKETRKIKASHCITPCEMDIPEEYIRNEIAYQIHKEIRSYIDYEVSDDRNGEKIYTGELEIVIKN